MNSLCPCGSQAGFDICCGPLITGTVPRTAEALMRSRYTAYTLGNLEYVEQTCSEKAMRSFNRVDMEKSLPGTEWKGLKVTDTSGGQQEDITGTVNFTFRYRHNGRDFAQTEISKFIRVDGIWKYDDSEINPKAAPVRVAHIGRNDACTCGSGKKYKKCCGA